jgi:hypothetical protein
MTEALRDVDGAMVVAGELDRDVAEVRRTLRSQVDDDVEHGAAGTADELRLGGRRILEVDAADRAAKPVEADVRLRDDRLQPVLGKLVLAEGAREEPPVVLPSLEIDDKGSLQLGLGEEQVRSFLYRVVLDRGAAPARIAASPLARSAALGPGVGVKITLRP